MPPCRFARWIALFALSATTAGLAGGADTAGPATAPAVGMPAELPDAERAYLLGDDAGTTLVVGGKRSTLYNRWGVGPCYWATVDATNGRLKKRVDLGGGPAVVRGVTPAADGRHVLLWGDQPGRAERRLSPAPYLALWDVAAGAEVSRFGEDLDFVVRAAAVSPDGRLVLTAQDARPLRLWDARAGRLLRSVQADRNVECLALAADGRHALLGAEWNDENVYVWDLELNQEVRRFAGHHGVVTSVAFSPDERRVLSASLDGTVRLWDRQSGRELRRLRPGAAIQSAAFTPDGHGAVGVMSARPRYGELYMQVVPGTELRLWDLPAAAELAKFDVPGKPVTSIGFAAGGRELVAASADRIHRRPLPPPPDGGRARLALDEPRLPNEPDHQLFCLEADEIHYVGFLPDGRAFSAGDRNTITRWDAARGAKAGASAPAAVLQWPDVRHVSADGRFAVSLQRPPNNEAFLWELASGLVVARPTPKETVHGAALTPDGTLLALGLAGRPAAGAAADRGADAAQPGPRLAFYRTGDGSEAGSVAIPGCGPALIAFPPDGNTVAVVGGDPKRAVSVFELDTAKLVRTYAAPAGWSAQHLEFSRDGSRLMAVTYSGVIVWDREPAKVVGQLTVTGGSPSVRCAALSPDGRRVLTGGLDTNLRLWDVDRQAELAVFDHHRYPPASVAFSPDGRTAVSGSHERTLRVWKLPE